MTNLMTKQSVVVTAPTAECAAQQRRHERPIWKVGVHNDSVVTKADPRFGIPTTLISQSFTVLYANCTTETREFPLVSARSVLGCVLHHCNGVHSTVDIIIRYLHSVLSIFIVERPVMCTELCSLPCRISWMLGEMGFRVALST